jgi:hypothetical protein
MNTTINSIYTSELNNGQLWIGSTGNEPSTATLTPGTNIAITNGSGSIDIGALGIGSITWQTVTTGANPILPFIGYIINGSGTFQYNSSANIGDMYIIATGSNNASNFGLTSNAANIHFGGSTIASLTSTSTNAAICLVGVGFGNLNVLFSTGTFI